MRLLGYNICIILCHGVGVRMKNKAFAFVITAVTALAFLSSCGLTYILSNIQQSYEPSYTSSEFTWSEPQYEKVEPIFNSDGQQLVILNYEVNVGDMYYRNLLAEDERMVYDFIAEALYNLEYSVTLPETSPVVLERIVQSYILDHPETFYWRGAYSYITYNDGTMQIHFTDMLNKDTVKSYRNSIDKAAEEYLSYITADMTQYEAEVIIHDLLVRNIKYTENIDLALPENFNIFGALVNNDAVCSGYSSAFKYLCNKVGISVISVTGVAGDESHQWNIVSIGETSFNVDVTWDDPTFDDGSEMLTYQYFNLTTDEFTKTHTPSNDFLLPSCQAPEYAYCEKYGFVINAETEIYSVLVDAIVFTMETKDSYSDGVYDIFLKVNSDTCLYSDACDIILDKFPDAIDEAVQQTNSIYTDWNLIYLANDEISPYAAFSITLS